MGVMLRLSKHGGLASARAFDRLRVTGSLLAIYLQCPLDLNNVDGVPAPKKNFPFIGFIHLGS
jgi:hypothetical protein